MDVNDVKRIYDFAIAKNNGQGYNSPDDFNLNIKFAARSYLDYLLGQYQKYQAGRPIPVVQFGENQRVRTSIIPLVYDVVLPVNNLGFANYPDDLEQVDAMWTLYGFYNIRFAQQDRMQSYYRSTIDPVNQNPVYLIQHEGFHFFPENISFAKLSYIRTPPDMIWGYDEVNGVETYNPAKSTQPVWADTDLLNIIVRALALAGVNLQLGIVMQYANEIKQGGQ